MHRLAQATDRRRRRRVDVAGFDLAFCTVSAIPGRQRRHADHRCSRVTDTVRVAGGQRGQPRRGERLDALPPRRPDAAAVRFGGAEHQPLPCPGHRHVEAVQLFALAGSDLPLQHAPQRRRAARFGLGIDEGAAQRMRRLHRPVDQHAGSLGLLRLGVGVHHEDDARLQPFGAVNGQQLHGLGLTRQRQLGGAALERAHEVVGRGVARAVQRE